CATSPTAWTSSSPASAPAVTSPASARRPRGASPARTTSPSQRPTPAVSDFSLSPAHAARWPVSGGGEPAPHRLRGIGAGFVPANLHTDTLDGVIQVSEEDGYAHAVRSASEGGIFVRAAS